MGTYYTPANVAGSVSGTNSGYGWGSLLSGAPNTANSLAALSAIPAGAFPTVGSSSGQTTSNLNTTQNLSGSATSGYGTAGNAVISQLMPMISKLSTTPNLSGYEAGQQQGINQQYNAEGTQVNNDLAARGLSRSPAAAAAVTNIGNARSGATTQLQQSIPLLSNQLEQSNAGSINSILNSLPKTSTTSQGSTSNQSGNTTQNVQTSQGGGISGLFSGLGVALSNLFKG